MKKAILFDLEGTLITLDRQHYITDLALKENGVYLDIPKIYKIRGFDKYNSSEEFFKALIVIHKFNLDSELFLKEKTEEIINEHIQKLDHKDLSLAEKAREKYRKMRYGNIEKKDELYPNTIKTLEILSKDYLLGVYTARKKYSAQGVLENLNIDKYFDFILGEETKRSPEPSLKIIEKCKELDINIEESYLAGDSETDIKHGKMAGLKTILVLTGNGSIALQKKIKPDYTIHKVQNALKELIRLGGEPRGPKNSPSIFS